MNSESPPPAKRSRPADGHSRRVTFNPNVQERALQPVNEPPKPVTLKEAADIVVRYLDPFYTQGKFATKVSVIFQPVMSAGVSPALLMDSQLWLSLVAGAV